MMASDVDPDLQPGSVVDRYVVEGLLGRGAMAVVYRVRHAQLGTSHAMKVLTASSRSIRERLLQEGRLQASLTHPNIVRVVDVVSIDGSPGLVMDLVRGPTLEDLLAETTLSLDVCDALATGIIEGVAHAHEHGLIHRDLKPSNILVAVTAAGLVPKVADFGLAKILHGEGGATHTQTGAMMGTPAYMAPEQIRNSKHVDQRADVFALGAILYQIVTGHRCFGGEDLLDVYTAIGAGTFVAPRTLRPDIAERMERAILGAMVVDRERRTQTCAALLEIWGEGSGGVPVRATVDLAAVLHRRYSETLVPTSGRVSEERSWPGTRVPVSRGSGPPAVETWIPEAPVAARVPGTGSLAPVVERSAEGAPRPRRAWPLGGAAVGLVGIGLAVALWGGLGEPGGTPRLTAAEAPAVLDPGPAVAIPGAGGLEALAPADPAASLAPSAPRTAEDPADGGATAAGVGKAALERVTTAAPAALDRTEAFDVTVSSRPVALQGATIDGGLGTKRGRVWVFALGAGRHTADLVGADGRTAHASFTADSDRTWCWDFDLEAECAR